MTLVFDTLRISTVTDELDESEIHHIKGLFDVHEYRPGEVITQPGDKRPDSLYILAQGNIEVKASADGKNEDTLHVLKQGDLAGMITFVGGDSSQISAKLCATGNTKVISLEQRKVEDLAHSKPMIALKIMRGVARSMHGIVRRGNSQTLELTNYIHGINGRY
ncbi:MAG TPA: cyclic nucleotide-binding domain-containing protein [Gallionella sp.]